MLRLIAYLLISVVLISILRMVIGIAAKAFSGYFSSPAQRQATRASAGAQTGGELKRDPVCGTYILPSAAVTKTVGGEVVYFCSPSCRDKHSAA
jgi:YHS domain-containing protein